MAKIRLRQAVAVESVASVRLLEANARLKTASTAAQQTRLRITQGGARPTRENGATVAGSTERLRVTQEGAGSTRENAASLELTDVEEGRGLIDSRLH